MDKVAKDAKFPQPFVVVRGEVRNLHDGFMCVEGKVVCEVPLDSIPYILLCVFYTFNLQYTQGCTNFYSFMEYLFLGVTPPKRSKLQHFITSITNASS